MDWPDYCHITAILKAVEFNRLLTKKKSLPVPHKKRGAKKFIINNIIILILFVRSHIYYYYYDHYYYYYINIRLISLYIQGSLYII